MITRAARSSLLCRLRALALAAALIAAGACTTLDRPGGPAARPSEQLAAAHVADARYADAARVYEALAAGAVIDADRLYLLAAANWLDAGRRAEAEAARASVSGLETGDPLERLETLVDAGLAVAAGDAAAGLAALDTLASAPLSLDERLRYQATRARALFALGEPAEAVSLLARREFWLDTEGGISANHQLIWDGLRASDEAALTDALQSSTDRTVTGWVSLVLAANRALGNENALRIAVLDWQRRNPAHAANSFFVPALLGDVSVVGGPPRQVALLLPLSGRERGAAAAIRDGFMAAYLADAAAIDAPSIRVYDSSANGAILTYEQALLDGADVVVGPLTRTAVRELALMPELPVPVLTLNNLSEEELPPAAFYQFALAPEDEARQAAERAAASGMRRAIALVPLGDWGERVLTSFARSLEASGGRLLDYEYYNPAETDFSRQIERVTQISASVARRNRLRSLVDEPMQFEPRRRQDIDFVFIAARPANARALKPQLRFHYAGDLPVYATSAVHAEDGRSNSDLRDILFPDIPWLIAPELAPPPTLEEFSLYWRATPQVARLYAMGMDAYRLLGALFVDAAYEPVHGATGTLRLEADGRITRSLNWARHDGTQPVRLPDLLPPPLEAVEPADAPWREPDASE